MEKESGPLVRLRSEAEKEPLSRPYGTFYVVSNVGAAPHSSGQRPRGACRRQVGFVPSPISSPKKLMFLLFCAHLFATLAPQKLLSFGNETKNFGFCFAFRSLIRNFGSAEATFVRK